MSWLVSRLLSRLFGIVGGGDWLEHLNTGGWEKEGWFPFFSFSVFFFLSAGFSTVAVILAKS